MKKVFIFLFALAVMLSSAVSADDDQQFKFAEKLFSDADYYRAIGEYKRYLFYNETGKYIENAEYKIGLSYLGAEKWDEAINAFEGIESKYPDRVKELSVLAKGEAYSRKKDYVFSNSVFDMFINEYHDSDLLGNAEYMKGWNYIYMQKWDEAKQIFDSIDAGNAGTQEKDSAASISSGLDRKKKVDSRSPIIAGLLSAILPGAGHVYCGRWTDALASLFIDGIFMYEAANAYARKDTLGTVVYGIPAATFYSSTIYGSVAAANKFNDDATNKFIKSLEDFKVDVISVDF